MKKIILSLMSICLVLMVGIMLVGCNIDGDNTENTGNTNNTNYTTKTIEICMNMVDGSSVASSNTSLKIEYVYHGEQKTAVLKKIASKQFVIDDGSIYRINYDLAENESFCYWQLDDTTNTSTVTDFSSFAEDGNKVTANFASCASQTVITSKGVVTVLDGTITLNNDIYTVAANNNSSGNFSYWLTNNQLVDEDTSFNQTFQISTLSGSVVYKAVYDKVVGFASFFSTSQNVLYNSWNAYNLHKSDFYDYAHYYFNGTDVDTNMTLNSDYYYKKFDNIPNTYTYFWGTIYAFDNGTTYVKFTPRNLDYGFGYNYFIIINGQRVNIQIEMGSN